MPSPPETGRPQRHWGIRLLLLLIGLMFTLPPLIQVSRFIEFRLHASAAPARVVKIGRGLFNRPFLHYTDRQGNGYEFKSEIPYHFFFAPKLGDSKTIYYRTDHPEVAITKSPTHYLLMPLLFAAMGLYLLWTAIRRPLPAEEASGWEKLCRWAGLGQNRSA